MVNNASSTANEREREEGGRELWLDLHIVHYQVRASEFHISSGVEYNFRLQQLPLGQFAARTLFRCRGLARRPRRVRRLTLFASLPRRRRRNFKTFSPERACER